MNPHNYENYTRPHMKETLRKAEERRLAEALTPPVRVQLGHMMVRAGRRLLHEQTAHQPKPITKPIPEVFYP